MQQSMIQTGGKFNPENPCSDVQDNDDEVILKWLKVNMKTTCFATQVDQAEYNKPANLIEGGHERAKRIPPMPANSSRTLISLTSARLPCSKLQKVEKR